MIRHPFYVRRYFRSWAPGFCGWESRQRGFHSREEAQAYHDSSWRDREAISELWDATNPQAQKRLDRRRKPIRSRVAAQVSA